MNDAELARHRRKLIELRDALVREGDVEIEPLRDGTTEKVDDDAAPLAEMQQVIASKRNRERATIMGRITAALRRLDDDPEMFGLCSECEEPIGKRLDVMPYVELCTECQHARDGSPRAGARRHLRDFK